jgi:hypothetical protein
MEFLISSLGGIPLGIKNRIDVEFPIYPGEFPGYKGMWNSDLTLEKKIHVQVYKFSEDLLLNYYYSK